MNIFFKIGYKTRLKKSLLGSKTVYLDITSVGFKTEEGTTLHLENMSIRKMQRRIQRFLMMHDVELDIKTDFIVFVGYDAATEYILLRELVHGINDHGKRQSLFLDVDTVLRDMAASFTDDFFGLGSPFTLQRPKVPSANYSVKDKIDMIMSHPEFPEPYEGNSALEYAEWIERVQNFKLLNMWLIGTGLHIMVNDSFSDIAAVPVAKTVEDAVDHSQ